MSLGGLNEIISRFIKEELTFGISKLSSNKDSYEIWREATSDETVKNKISYKYTPNQVIVIDEGVLRKRKFCIIYEKGELVK